MKFIGLIVTVLAVIALAIGLDLYPEPVERSMLAADYDIAELRSAYAGSPDTWPAPVIIRTEGEDEDFSEMAALPRVSTSSTPDLAELGEALFFSPVLSANEDIACASCHVPEHGFAATDRQAVGHQGMMGTRNAPGLLGVSLTAPYFWDGRADTLEAQALGPILNPIEMAGSRTVLEERLNTRKEWRDWFANTVGKQQIKLEDVAIAISAYERTLVQNTRFDAFLRGDNNALTDQELQGLHLFRTKAQCMSCHDGQMLSDGQAHNIGLTYYGRRYQDRGIYERSGLAEDVGKFNTPSLRFISQTAPYMHNGLFPHLRGIVNLYNAGGARPRRRDSQLDDPLFPQTSERLKPLELTSEERDALVAFLETL